MAQSVDNVLVTGATGFIGRAFCRHLETRGLAYREVSRQARAGSDGNRVVLPSVGPETDWSPALEGVAAVVHLAARVHVMQEAVTDPEAAFFEVNVAGTERLAKMAADAGVRRFVFVSSVAVHGVAAEGRSLTELDKPNPRTPYARSKLQAEQELWRIARESNLEVVVVRPPMVYGPEAPGNLPRLMRWIARGLPLPLGSVRNQRSFLGVSNLVNFLDLCLTHPEAPGQAFLVADDRTWSTPELIRRLAQSMGTPCRVFPFPVGVLKWGARFLGRERMIQRLCSSLVIDAGKARSLLGWTPTVTSEDELDRTVRSFLAASEAG